MIVGDKLKGFSNSVQQKTQQASYGLVHMLFRVITGFFIGIVLSLIAQEIFQFQSLILVFLTLVLMSAIYKSIERMSLFQILVFDLICILIATLLRMYIMIAPN
jgi:K+-sensing histidine kinase KdpD